MPLSQEKKVIWIRVAALGDCLIATAALHETIQRFSGQPVYVMGPRFWTELLEPRQWPALRGIIVIDKKQGELFEVQENNWVSAREKKPLSDFFSDAGVVVNHRIESFRYSWAPFFRRVPVRIGSCPWPMKWLYTDWAPWLGKDPLLHERDWHLDVALSEPWNGGFAFGVEEARRRFENRENLKLKKSIDYWNKKGLPLLREKNFEIAKPYLLGFEKEKYVLVNPTSSRYEKAWPREKFREFLLGARELLEKKGLTAFVIGSPQETDWLKDIAKEDFKIVQPRSLADLVQVVSFAKCLVTNTSSMQFISASQDTRTVTLMGQAKPEQWGPLGPQDIVVLGEVPSGFDGNIFQRDLEAYKSIPVSRVLDALKKTI